VLASFLFLFGIDFAGITQDLFAEYLAHFLATTAGSIIEEFFPFEESEVVDAGSDFGFVQAIGKQLAMVIDKGI
jgi:hypothetical protein